MATNKGRGYLLSGESFMPFDVPGSLMTAGWDISPRGDVVGVYRDAANKFHGFRWDDDGFAAVDYPGASATRTFGLNARGDLVGAYTDSANKTHGYVAVVAGNRP
jgi:hypothetical protein